MKNLMIYIGQDKSFENQHKKIRNDAHTCAQIQIENSLSLGWKPKDIVIITNFSFSYMGVDAMILPNVDYFDLEPQASKINALVAMFEADLIEKNELYWFHDLDAFQFCPFSETEIKIGNKDLAIAQYSVWARYRWNMGSFFFKIGAKDIFEKIKKYMYKSPQGFKLYDEEAMEYLTKFDKNIKQKIKRINLTYNFRPRSSQPRFELVHRPIKIAHFHPFSEGANIYKNIPEMPKKLTKIFEAKRADTKTV